ncbi:hypothetical protein L226DRAFT_536029 [Lentinus tigrinus ALCF2SS1-7]|uniref:Uncharacterized protein n=1 Tax=Lentinus tigrinus ALCF2SS1-6 TaxID=1328759 RepID=A0A5C2RRR6_9APHY|nr:hypothetical protein L227DRAFT_616563 [Lentinus tigrinus ALCF2SS1-6]RPD73753.1 hypothetical protein L226DRAFT_536029 [Lentinus tigrinus ALCF2SS1-7]
MAYEYYRSSAPGWGTSQYQFGPPPMPGFQPQPTWTGYDFYNAHALNPDPTLYNSVIGRLGSYSGPGLDHRTAHHWHSLIYSGMQPLTQALPADIGAAAAYEVYRTWKYNSSLYQPLSADRMMQREGLIGMAIGEATRLWQYSGRPMDAYGQRAACEAAAATAAILADQFTSMLGGGATMFPPSPVMSPYMPSTPVSMGYAGSDPGYLSAGNAYGGYSPSAGTIAAPAGSTLIVSGSRHHSHERGRSHSRDRYGDHHHHHHRRGRSVEVIQTGGSGYGYQPYYGTGYAGGYAPGYSGYGYGGNGGYGGGYSQYGYGGRYSPSGCVIC